MEREGHYGLPLLFPTWPHNRQHWPWTPFCRALFGGEKGAVVALAEMECSKVA